MDVRVGGRERAIGKFADGSESRFEALYFDIVPERRLVYTYDMYWQGKKISVSLASVEFVAQGKDGSRGTKLIVTEQHAFLDGYEDAGNRERGTQGLMDNLEVALGGRRHPHPAQEPSEDPGTATQVGHDVDHLVERELLDHRRHLLRGLAGARAVAERQHLPQQVGRRAAGDRRNLVGAHELGAGGRWRRRGPDVLVPAIALPW